MRRGRGVTPPSVERSFGLQYYPTCLASSSRVKTCRGRRGARQGANDRGKDRESKLVCVWIAIKAHMQTW